MIKRNIVVLSALIILLMGMAIVVQTQETGMSEVNQILTLDGISAEIQDGEDGAFVIVTEGISASTSFFQTSPFTYAGVVETGILGAVFEAGNITLEDVVIYYDSGDDGSDEDHNGVMNGVLSNFSVDEDENYTFTFDLVELTTLGKDIPTEIVNFTIYIPVDGNQIQVFAALVNDLGLRGPNVSSNCSPLAPTCSAADDEETAEEEETPEVTPEVTPETEETEEEE